MKNLLLATSAILLLACNTTKLVSNADVKNVVQQLKDNQTFVLNEISTDKTYGYSEKNPIQVGGVSSNEGPVNERRFLNALAGPNGEKVTYYRQGSCCPIKSSKDPFGTGKVMLDNYRVTWEGASDTVSIYINMYDSSELKAPKGFTIKK